MNNILVEYVRDDWFQPIGVVVAVDKDKIGWSLCHSTKDKFNKELGLKIAIGRALKGKTVSKPAPILTFVVRKNGRPVWDGEGPLFAMEAREEDIVSELIEKMRNRASRYFK